MAYRKSKNTLNESHYIFICLIIFIASIVYELPLYADTPQDGWKIEMHATRADIIDQGRLIIGANSTSSNGYDIYDDEHPPIFPNRYLDLFTKHNQAEAGWENQKLLNMKYRAEFGAPLTHDGRVIDFYSETDQSGSITLTWTISDDIHLPAYYMKLTDVSTGAIVDMREQSSYIANVQAGQHHFQLELTYGRQAPPVANNQSVTTAEDTPVAITLTATDPNEDPLTYSIVTQSAHGSLSGTPPSVTYTPASYYYGTDSFSFKANDGQLDSNIATVTIAIAPVNDAPISSDQAVTGMEGTPLNITLVGADVDGDPLTYRIVTAPSHGYVSGTLPNTVYYPESNYNGTDSFQFKANDGYLDSNIATVQITITAVHNPPVAGFTVPGEASNTAVRGNNVASANQGAIVVAYSSYDTAYLSPPENAIDDNVSTRWATAYDQFTDQYITIQLAGGRIQTIDRIRLVSTAYQETAKHFEIQVSTTAFDDPNAFISVLEGVTENTTRVQEFILPYAVQAKYLKFIPKDKWGGSDAHHMAISSIEAIDSRQSGLPVEYETPPNVALLSEGAEIVARSSESAPGAIAENAIDGNTNSHWDTAIGQTTNQYIIIKLARGDSFTIDRIRLFSGSIYNLEVKHFNVDVSNTTTDESAFTRVLNNVVAQQVYEWQEFAFLGGPVSARYVRFVAVDNYGGLFLIS